MGHQFGFVPVPHYIILLCNLKVASHYLNNCYFIEYVNDKNVDFHSTIFFLVAVFQKVTDRHVNQEIAFSHHMMRLLTPHMKSLLQVCINRADFMEVSKLWELSMCKQCVQLFIWAHTQKPGNRAVNIYSLGMDTLLNGKECADAISM